MKKYRFLGFFFLMIQIILFAGEKTKPLLLSGLSVKSPQEIADTPRPYSFFSLNRSSAAPAKIPMKVSFTPPSPINEKVTHESLIKQFNEAFQKREWSVAENIAKKLQMRQSPLSKLKGSELLLCLSCAKQTDETLSPVIKRLQQVKKNLEEENKNLKNQLALKQSTSGKSAIIDADIPGIDDVAQEFPSLIKELQSEGETPQETIKKILTKSKELPALEKLKDRIIIELGQKAYDKMSANKELLLRYIDPSARFFKMISGMQIDPESGKLKVANSEDGKELSPEENLVQTQLRLAQLTEEHEKLKSECSASKEDDTDESEEKVVSADEKDALRGLQEQIRGQQEEKRMCEDRLVQVEREAQRKIEALSIELEEAIANSNRLGGKVEGLEHSLRASDRGSEISRLYKEIDQAQRERDRAIGEKNQAEREKDRAIDTKERVENEKVQAINTIKQDCERAKREEVNAIKKELERVKTATIKESPDQRGLQELEFSVQSQKGIIESLRKENNALKRELSQRGPGDVDAHEEIERLKRELQALQRIDRMEERPSPARINRIRQYEEENRKLREEIRHLSGQLPKEDVQSDEDKEEAKGVGREAEGSRSPEKKSFWSQFKKDAFEID